MFSYDNLLWQAANSDRKQRVDISAQCLLHLGPLLAPMLIRTLPIIPQLVLVTASEDIPTILSVNVQTYCIPGEHARCDPQTEISLSQHTDIERRE